MLNYTCCRVHPSKDWIQSQIPEIVQNVIGGLGDEMGDVDEMDAEAFVQAYVNIVVGSCISIGRWSNLLIYKQLFVFVPWFCVLIVLSL